MNNILQNLILVVLMVGLQTSCSVSVKPNSVKQSDKQDVELFTNGNKTTKNAQNASLGIYEGIVYSVVIEDIFYRTEFGDIPKSNWLAYRKTTVPVENIKELKESSQVSSDLLVNLQDINNTSKILDDGYDVKLALQVVNGKGDLEQLFEESQRKNPKIAAIMEFSRIAFNAEKTEALVYVRFYSSEKNLQERYCIVTLEIDDVGIYKKDLKWINL